MASNGGMPSELCGREWQTVSNIRNIANAYIFILLWQEYNGALNNWFNSCVDQFSGFYLTLAIIISERKKQFVIFQ